ncbi:transmembrane protein 145 [Aplysia californica]|uniref:Transmembrane protein 145 n=1 Tax=Aplysia californica TaxID=6500 RepID=A0ABM1AAM5_APLCA|nr:transmembrane protein 145 [Aplysia californica]
MRIAGIVWFIVATLPQALAKWREGVIDTDRDWAFLTRFCFLTQQGSLSYDFKYPVGYGTQEILMYYDDPGQWDSIYKRGKNCTQKMSVLSITSNQILALNTSVTQTSKYAGCTLFNQGGDTWYHCVGQRTFRSSRERWWYIAVARCGPPKDLVTGLYLEFKVHMTNGDDLLHKEFSADEFYILPVDIVFFIIYLVMLAMSVVCAVVLRSRQLFHTTYKMYMFALVLWQLHLFLMVVAWCYYGVTGWEEAPVEVTGRVLRAASNTIFILLLILMAKGYTITRGRLPISSTIKITVFMSVYAVIISVLFIWEGLLFDPGKVLYYYESPPGYGLIAMQLIAWLWFLYSLVFTLKHCSSKTRFYIPFFSFYTVWFWASPVVTLVAMFAMAKWSREKTVNGVEQFVGFVGHTFFLFLTRPSAANGNFPYHVRTTQIATMGGEEHLDGNPYTVSSRDGLSGSGPNLEFFITSKEVDNEDTMDGESRVIFSVSGQRGNPPSYNDPPPAYPQVVERPGVASSSSVGGSGDASTVHTTGAGPDHPVSSAGSVQHIHNYGGVIINSVNNNNNNNNVNNNMNNNNNNSNNSNSLVSNVNSNFQARNAFVPPILSGLPPSAGRWALPPLVRGSVLTGHVPSAPPMDPVEETEQPPENFEGTSSKNKKKKKKK